MASFPLRSGAPLGSQVDNAFSSQAEELRLTSLWIPARLGGPHFPKALLALLSSALGHLLLSLALAFGFASIPDTRCPDCEIIDTRVHERIPALFLVDNEGRFSPTLVHDVSWHTHDVTV